MFGGLAALALANAGDSNDDDDEIIQPLAGRGRSRARGRGGGRRGGGRGRSQGFAQSEETKLRIKTSMLNKSKARLINKSAQSIQKHECTVVSNIFGQNSSHDSRIKRSKFRSVDVGDANITIVGRAGDTTRRDRKRVLTSYVHAQADGAKRWLTETGEFCSFNIANIFDDASMWTARPQPKDSQLIGPGTDPTVAKELSKNRKRGRMVQTPVLSLEERIHKRFRLEDPTKLGVAGLKVHCSSQTLPQANFGTVNKAWKQMSVFNGSHPGDKIDPKQVLKDCISSPHWKNIAMIRDNLPLNNNIVGEVESRCSERRQRGDTCAPTVLSMNCQGHSTQLTLKPVARRQVGLIPFIVRCGHVSQSSRQADKYSRAIDSILDDSWRYKRVTRYPDGYENWQSANRKVLEKQRFLTTAEIDQILKFDNGDWNGHLVFHYCIADICPCRGNAATAKEKTRAALHLSVGPHCQLALDYRWKHCNEAAAWALTGRKQHDILLRGFLIAFNVADIQKAMDLIARYVGQDNDGAVNSCKLILKASKMIDFMMKDPDGKSLLRLLILQNPLHHFLNGLFEVEKLITEFQQMSYLVEAGSCATPESDLYKAFEKALEHNLPFFNGERARQIEIECVEMALDFEHAYWEHSGLTRADKFGVSLSLLCVGGVSYRRLRFPTGQPKFETFDVCPKDVRSCEDMRLALQPLVDKRDHCSQCIDESFSLPWLQRCTNTDTEVCAQAQRALRHICATTQPTSVVVEKKHPLGQEIRSNRGRGAAPGAETLAATVFEKSVRQEHACKTTLVEDRHIGTCRRQLGHAVSANCLNRRRVADERSEAVRILSQQRSKFTKPTAFGEYKRVHWPQGVKPCTAEGRDATVALHEQFAKLAPVAAAHYEGQADARHKALLELGPDELFRAAAENEHIATQKMSRTARRLAMEATLKNIASDKAWSAGAAIDSHGFALKPELVLKETDSKIDEMFDNIFGRIKEIVPNPAANPKSQQDKVCYLLYGGMCMKDAEVHQCVNAVYNIYCVLKQNSLTVNNLPLLIRLAGDTDAVVDQWWLLTDSFGRGELQILLQMVADSSSSCVSVACPPVYTTSHLTICRIIKRIALARKCSTHLISSLKLEVHNFCDDATSKGLCLERTGIRFEKYLSLVAKVNRGKGKTLAKPSELVKLPFGMQLFKSELDDTISKAQAELPSHHDDSDSDKDLEQVSDIGSQSCSDSCNDSNDEGAAKPVAEDPIIFGSTKAAGIQSFQKAPSSLSKCCFCPEHADKKIKKGEYRFRYQLHATTKLGDNLCCHALCVLGCPDEQKPMNVRILNFFAREERPAEEVSLLQDLASRMQG